jgi:carbamoylphosphate synthase large subunit
MRELGNKVAARNLAISVGVPVVPATDPLPDDMTEVKRWPPKIGYPVMLKASWGGGGRGMRAIRDPSRRWSREVTEGKREAKAAFGKDEVYLEKLIERARHVEVQLLGDTTATSCICSSATAPSSAATRRSSSGRLRPTFRRRCATSWPLFAEDRPAMPPTISAPARSSSCWMPIPESSTSSR